MTPDVFDQWCEWADLHNADVLDLEQFDLWLAEGRAR